MSIEYESHLDLDDQQMETMRILENGLIYSTRKQMADLKNLIKREKSNISSIKRNTADQHKANLEVRMKFLDDVLIEIGKIEHKCIDVHSNLESEAAEETLERLIPPSNISLNKLKEALDESKQFIEFTENEEIHSDFPQLREWINIPATELDYTGDIKSRRRVNSSIFDESDLKFKQELTILRKKMFSLSTNSNVLLNQKKSQNSISSPEFVNLISKNSFVMPDIKTEISKIKPLKFVKGKPKIADDWKNLLDSQGNQLTTKWYLLISPQLENILKKRKVPLAYFNPLKTMKFLSRIPENGIGVILTREDIRLLLENPEEAWPWIREWKLQFSEFEGDQIAATLIQASWRGYLIRKKLHESECKYIAASLIWFAWEKLKVKRRIHRNYLMKLQMSLFEARSLSLKLMKNYDELIMKPHIVIHLPSLGYPQDIRRTFSKLFFLHRQNNLDLKFSCLRNPNAEVIYFLPVKFSENLVEMYHSIIDSIVPNAEEVKKRLTFVELRQTDLFQNQCFNVSRTCYFCAQSFYEIRKKIKDKSCYYLPWVMDEYDTILSDHYKIPLLAPSLEYQRNLLNKSYLLDMINSLNLKQLPYVSNIKNYQTLCNELAELICRHTEVFSWLIKINEGTSKHVGIFYINHLTVPFMPILREERSRFREEDWRISFHLRGNYLKTLKESLPELVSRFTKLPSFYKDWSDFEIHLVKYGAVIQAAEKEKIPKIVSVSLFISGKASGKKSRWTGTADKYLLDDSNEGCTVYIIPENSVEIYELEPTVEKLSDFLEDNGYFGYIVFDFYCKRRLEDEKLELFVVDIHPYYSHTQYFNDWIKFSVNGSYNKKENTIDSKSIFVTQDNNSKKQYNSNDQFYDLTNGNENVERHAVVIVPLQHSTFSDFSFSEMSVLARNYCDIKFDIKKKEGTNLIPVSGDNTKVILTSIGSAIKPIIAKVEMNLKNLRKILTGSKKSNKEPIETNFSEVLKFFTKLNLDYETIYQEKCIAENVFL